MFLAKLCILTFLTLIYFYDSILAALITFCPEKHYDHRMEIVTRTFY